MGRNRKSGPGRQRSGSPLISTCLIAKNEEEFIARSIASACELGGEVLIGDTGSTDGTVAIAKEAGARVFRVTWQDDFAAAKNAVLERARGRWIVFMDADEWFKAGDARRLRELIEASDQNVRIVGINVYQTNLQFVDRSDILDRSKTVRVFRNCKEHRYLHPIHEQIIQSLTGIVLDTDLELIHVGFAESVARGKQKSDRNLRILTQYIEGLSADAPHRRYLLMQRGREYQRLGERQQAKDQYLLAAQDLLASAIPQQTPFSAILFRYLCEVLMDLREFQTVLEVCDRFRPWVVFPQADLYFFEGAAMTELGRLEEAAQKLLIAISCSEGADHVQEYGSNHRTVLSYVGAARCLRFLGQPLSGYAVAARGLNRFPNSTDLSDEADRCLQMIAPEHRQGAMEAAQALGSGSDPVGSMPTGSDAP